MYLDPTGFETEEDKIKFGEYSLKYQLLQKLGQMWYGAEKSDRGKIHKTANDLRTFDDNSFNRAILLNDSDGAAGAGHMGLLLLNEIGEGLLFSYYPTDISSPLSTPGEVRFDILSKDRVDNLLYGDGEAGDVVATDADVVRQSDVTHENYDRWIYYDITNAEGYNMYNAIVFRIKYPGTYKLFGNQCDNNAAEVMGAGNYKYTPASTPNITYEILALTRASHKLGD